MDYKRKTAGRKPHNPGHNMPLIRADTLAKILGKPTIDEQRAAQLAEERATIRQRLVDEQASINEAVRLRRMKENPMTVSLYKSTANGSREIVVQTNAQSLDVFISGLADALAIALQAEPELAAHTIAATLKNAFPVAFSISGYKAEKVSESKLLTCGYASPDASELVAQSTV